MSLCLEKFLDNDGNDLDVLEALKSNQYYISEW